MPQRSSRDSFTDFLLHFSSVKIWNNGLLVAAPMGQGIYMKREHQDWESLPGGLPEGVHVNRLNVERGRLFACTNLGLFEFDEQVDSWRDTGLALSSFHVKATAGTLWAATQYGLWAAQTAKGWLKIACSTQFVYDFLHIPEYLILALEDGIKVYDRLTGGWMNFGMQQAVIGLAMYQGHFLGITEKGALLCSNQKGSFEQIRFPHLFLFSLVTKGQEVYACTDRGLYRISKIGGRITLLSVRLGCPVTDIDCSADMLYMATLFQGIQRISI